MVWPIGFSAMDRAKRLMFAVWVSTGWLGGLLAVTVLSMLSYVAWHPFLEITVHFKVQYLVLSVLLAGLALLTVPRRQLRRFLLVVLICLSLQALDVVPWYFPYPQIPPVNGIRLRVLNLNVHYRNRAYDRVVTLVAAEQPDLVVLTEIDRSWLDQLQSIQTQLPYRYVEESDKPNFSSYSLAIYSRLPLENVSFKFLPQIDRPNFSGTLRLGDRTLTILATHPPPPLPGLMATRDRQLQALTNFAQQQPSPLILVGDLNLTMWSPYYRHLVSQARLHDPRRGRGILPTWAPNPQYSRIPSWLSPLFWLPIDHCLTSPDVIVTSFRTSFSVGSDHLPIMADLVLSRG